MQKSSRLLITAAVLAAGTLVSATQAEAAVKVGVLNCSVESGWGVIFGSSRDLRCTYGPTQGPPEHYYGKISKFGVDIGYTSGGVVVWDVVAPASGTRPGALAGDYAGATAGATVGVGLGVNALVGGLDRSFALQPVSFEGNKGLNVAAGIGSMNLTYDPPPGRPRS
jgi:hypothetical protein